jgi:hypothetical protein
MSEERRRQLRALLNEEWGKVGVPSTVVRFPRAMKRGAKVRRGPCAVVLPFPAQLSGEELQSRFRWICSNEGDWENEETEGAEHTSEKQRELVEMAREMIGWKRPTDATMRQRVAEGRRRIEKRNRVKDWLESLGVDRNEITTPEQALFLVFDRMHSRELPTSA